MDSEDSIEELYNLWYWFTTYILYMCFTRLCLTWVTYRLTSALEVSSRSYLWWLWSGRSKWKRENIIRFMCRILAIPASGGRGPVIRSHLHAIL